MRILRGKVLRLDVFTREIGIRRGESAASDTALRRSLPRKSCSLAPQWLRLQQPAAGLKMQNLQAAGEKMETGRVLRQSFILLLRLFLLCRKMPTLVSRRF